MEKLRQLMIFIRYVGLILANKAGLSKRKKSLLLKDYLRLKVFGLLPLFLKRRMTEVSFLNHKLAFFDLETTVSLIESIFIENEYFFKSKNGKPKIVDLGSNIGLSVIYFKLIYPNCEIDAFEADPTTIEMLKRNVNNFRLKKVKIFNLAVTDKSGSVDFYIDSLGSGSPLMSTNPLRINNKNKIVVPSIKLSDKIDGNKDFLKMDIEGSEFQVLHDLDSSKEISLFDQISIEYHHHIDKQQDRLADFLKILEKNSFGYQIHAGQNSPFELQVFEDIQVHAYKKSPGFNRG